MYLLDTNSVIYFFKGMGKVAENLFSHTPKEIVIPTIVIYELETGIAKSNAPEKRRAQLQLLLEQIEILHFGVEEAKAAASVRASLEKCGMPIGPIDTLIAGCAKANRLTLVTRNIKEFQRVEGLDMVDWYS